MPRKTRAIPSAPTAAAIKNALRSEATIATSASVLEGAGRTMSALNPAAPAASRTPSTRRIVRTASSSRACQPGRVVSPRKSWLRRPTAL